MKKLTKKLRKSGFGKQPWAFMPDHVTTDCSLVFSVKFSPSDIFHKQARSAPLTGHQQSDVQATIRHVLEVTENYIATKMKIITQSIQQLTKILADKGYNSMFHITGTRTDNFCDLLKTYCDEAIRNPMKPSFPFVVVTYTQYNMDNSGYIMCSFTLNHIDKKGIQITQMNIARCGMNHKTIEEWNKTIMGAIDIPRKEQANKKVMPVSMKKGRKKGLTF